MKDQRSINAVNVAKAYGRGKATKKELNAAYAAAAAAYADAAKNYNRLQTANICREVLTDVMFKKFKIK